MNHDEVAFLLSVGYSLAEIMRMDAERTQAAQGAAQGAQDATEAAQAAEDAQGAQGTQGATEGAQGTQGAQGAAEGAQDALKQENERLKNQIQELNRKNAVFEQAKEKTLDEILFKMMEDYK